MTPFESAYDEVAKLVNQFAEHEAEYLSHKYQESEVRGDFIDKFWKALGWDVNHKYQTNPREQEVKVEKNPDSNASGRKADYAFYLKPDYRNPIFFCEAKKPRHDLGSPEFYFQLVRYGRAAGTPVSVLFDFEELHVVDCRYEANLQKSFPSAQIKAFRYKDYLDRDKFGDIYWLFSREAVEAGKLKEFAKSLPKQRGKGAAKLTADEAKPADEALLTKLEEYRLQLAKAFKKADESLDAETLTEATQKVIDRLVFIRFLEDKNIEADYIVDQIAAKSRGGGASSPAGPTKSAWQSFIAWSKELDVKYNGVVFKPHEIDKPSFIPPDDKVFADICRDISFGHSKYIFSYIPIELIGSIYERFLGKVVTATAKRADIEYKPEVRKAGGVYYTPKYIVDYIVANTVGKILGSTPTSDVILSEAKDLAPDVATDSQAEILRSAQDDRKKLTPKEVSKLRFADIACGSGSFLIAVYDAVLHHVESWYNAHPEEARKAKCIEVDTGIFALSLRQKQQILLDNIYGVDIDPQAVEVAQLSLFLKLLEGESGATAGQMSFEKTKILPDLSKNIVCGNSLVDYDISDLFPLTPEEEERIKPFSFETTFRDIMRDGGFDAIVGNPPYGMVHEELMKDYLQSQYASPEGRFDRFELFIERSLKLLKEAGLFSYIVPTPVLTNLYSRKTRRFIFENSQIREIVNFGLDVFADPTVHTCILVLQKMRQPRHDYMIDVKKQVWDPLLITSQPDYSINAGKIASSDSYVIDIFVAPAHATLLEKLDQESTPLGDLCFLRQCIKTGDDLKYVVKASTYPGEPWKPSLRGKSIERYLTRESDIYLKYGNWLARNWKNRSFYETPKIAVRETGSRITATIDVEDRYFLSSLYAVYYKADNSSARLKALLAILNSTLCTFYIKLIAFNATEGAFTKIRTNQLGRFPIKNSVPVESFSTLVDNMLEVRARCNATKRDSERDQLQRKCEYLDAQIDRLVYELYGLTEDEIKIVEGRNA